MPKVKTQDLSDMAVEEISLVKEGANQGAKVVLWKNKEGAPSQKVEKEGFAKKLSDFIKLNMWGQGMQNPSTFNDLYQTAETQEMIEVLNRSLQNIMADKDKTPDEKQSLAEQSVNEFLAALKSGDVEETSSTGENPMSKELKKEMSVEEKAAAYDRLVASKKDDTAEKEKTKKSADEGQADGQEDKVEKSADEAVGALVAKALAPLTKQLEDLSGIVKTYREKDADVARLEKAKTIVKTSGAAIDPSELATLMKGMDDEQTASLEKMVKALGAQTGLAAILSPHGATVAKSASSDEVLLEQKAEELMKADSTLTKARAIAKTLKADSTLYLKTSRQAQ